MVTTGRGQSAGQEGAVDMAVARNRSVNFLSEITVRTMSRLLAFMGPWQVYVVSQAYVLCHDHSQCQDGDDSTCNDMHRLFRDPSLWKQVSLMVHGQPLARPPEFRGVFTNTQTDMLRKFGRYCEKLVITMNCFFVNYEFRDSLRDIVRTPSGKLSSLTLCLSLDSLQYFYQMRWTGRRYAEIDMYTLLRIMLEQGVDANLEITLLKADDDYEYLLELNESELLFRYTTSFSVPGFCPSERDIMQIGRFINMSPSAIIMSHFTHLQHLTLGMQNLSNQLLLTFATTAKIPSPRAPLRTLNIIFKTWSYDEDIATPELSEFAWNHLLRACPGFEVSCNIISFNNGLDPNEALSRVLKPMVPLVSATVDAMGPHWCKRVLSKCVKFCDTLRIVTCIATHLFKTSLLDVFMERLPQHKMETIRKGSKRTIIVT